MSDCSTNAMDPKKQELPKTCSNCGYCLKSPRFGGDAACVAKVIQGETQAGYAEIDMYNFGNWEACDLWIHRTDTLEQRYQQLEQVAKRMLVDLDSLVCTIPGLSADGVSAYRQQLKALGVNLDG